MWKSWERNEEINLYNRNVLQTSADVLDGLIGETMGMAVVDSGFSKTDAGKQWLELYKETLANKDWQIRYWVVTTNVFGEGRSIKSEGKVKLPALIGSTKVSIETEIIEANIPMFLSKESMKQAGTIINLNTDEIEMLGET